jgi:hypothetical protein
MGIPNMYSNHPGLTGGQFKFNDYFRSVGRTLNEDTAGGPYSRTMKQVQDDVLVVLDTVVDAVGD